MTTYEGTAATISECGLYRYDLRRVWQPWQAEALFVMLNPSTADAAEDDATIKRCVHFARLAGCGSLTVVNLFAFRATEPADMLAAADPVGPGNDAAILAHAARVGDGPVIAAWGAEAAKAKRPLVSGRPYAVLKLLAGVPLKCLAVTKGGQPGHPLYLKGDLGLIDFPRK